ncbi:hypothetical protein FRB91_007980 [Serendipita sp. 411]|nr:hypothetical protein FRB91_007980 [Serendipita sp. 411]
MDSRGSLTKKDTTISVITASEGVVSPPYSRTATLVGTPGSPLSKQPPPVVHRHYWRVSSAFICFFAIGWGDGATGVVMPDMQIYFHLSYVMGSMLFMTGSVGFALMTFVAEPVAKLLGRFNIASERPSFIPAIFTSKKTAHSLSKGRCISLFLFGLLHCAYFLFSASSPQYYGILIAFFIGGLGKSIQIAQINVFWTSNPRVPGISLLHGTYGIGAFVSPLICQTMKARGFPWRGFFWVSLGLALFNVLFGLYAFKTTQEEFEIEKSLALASEALSQTVARNQTDVEVGGIDSASASKPKLRMSEIARMPFVWTIATVLGVYQGAETIAQGFIVTFLLHERNANPNTVGYVASGFWAGLSIGRVTWGILSPRSANASLSLGLKLTSR